MKMRIYFGFAIFLMAIMLTSFTNAEVYLWNSVGVNNQTNLVTYHAFDWFDDTSISNVGGIKPVPIVLQYVVEPLPYSLIYGQVDWCNLTISHFENTYSTSSLFLHQIGGELINTTIITSSYYFSGTPLSTALLTFDLKSQDYLIADMVCHYTDVRSLYQENVLVGRFTTYMSSFECSGCTQYSLEELSHQTEQNENITSNQLGIFTSLQTAVNWNFQVWLILSWFIKIALVLVAVWFVFSGVYYIYIYLIKLGQSIK